MYSLHYLQLLAFTTTCFLLASLINMTGHFDLFWEKYNAMRKSGKTSRLWTKEEYARVVKLVSDDTYSFKDPNYKTQRKLKRSYQVIWKTHDIRHLSWLRPSKSTTNSSLWHGKKRNLTIKKNGVSLFTTISYLKQLTKHIMKWDIKVSQSSCRAHTHTNLCYLSGVKHQEKAWWKTCKRNRSCCQSLRCYLHVLRRVEKQENSQEHSGETHSILIFRFAITGISILILLQFAKILKQVDLCDYQTMKDGDFKYIFHAQFHFTKSSVLRPMKSKTAEETALLLLEVLLDFGCPVIIQSDNGREFVNKVE